MVDKNKDPTVGGKASDTAERPDSKEKGAVEAVEAVDGKAAEGVQAFPDKPPPPSIQFPPLPEPFSVNRTVKIHGIVEA